MSPVLDVELNTNLGIGLYCMCNPQCSREILVIETGSLDLFVKQT